MRVGSTITRSTARARGVLAALERADRRSLAAMGLLILALHVLGFGVLLGSVVPQHLRSGSGSGSGEHGVGVGVGVGLLAYTFGLRHAFDADHIAAVDNTTRKLLAKRASAGTGRRPLSVGFWFSLGHSTVVLALVLALGAGAKALARQLVDGGSVLHAVAAVTGPAVSGVFLWCSAA